MKFKCNIPKPYADVTGRNLLRFLVGGSEIARFELGLGDAGDGCKKLAAPEGWAVSDTHITGDVDAGTKITASFEYYTATGSVADHQTVTEVIKEDVEGGVELNFENSSAVTIVEDPVIETEDSGSGSDEEADDAGSDANSGDIASDGDGKEGTEDSLAKFKLTLHELKVLRSHNCNTFEDVKKYFEEQGSFEPMSGLSAKSGNVLAVKLGLVK